MYGLCNRERFNLVIIYNAGFSSIIHPNANSGTDRSDAAPDELSDTLEETRPTIDEPSQYIVYLINDDYTTFDFVVQVLVTIFKKSIEQAVKITNDVHHQGKGACGIYPKQIAETKIALVEDASSSAGFPLKCMMEEA